MENYLSYQVNIFLVNLTPEELTSCKTFRFIAEVNIKPIYLSKHYLFKNNIFFQVYCFSCFVCLFTVIKEYYDLCHEKNVYWNWSFIKRDEWYIKWQEVTTNWDEWQRVVQWITTSDSGWQRVVQRVTTSGTSSDNEWQRLTMSDSEW